MTLLEPGVAMSDYGLALECALFAWLVYRQRGGKAQLRFWFSMLFGALAFAALLGGTAHGLVADKSSSLHNVIWSGTLIAIGVAAFASWGAGARFSFNDRVAERVVLAAAIIFIIYVGLVFIGHRGFFIAIAHYLPAVLFLFVAMVVAWCRSRDAASLAGVLGVALTFVAAGVQQTDIEHRYFNHNTLYHLIQALALLLIYLAARRLIEQERN